MEKTEIRQPLFLAFRCRGFWMASVHFHLKILWLNSVYIYLYILWSFTVLNEWIIFVHVILIFGFNFYFSFRSSMLMVMSTISYYVRDVLHFNWYACDGVELCVFLYAISFVTTRFVLRGPTWITKTNLCWESDRVHEPCNICCCLKIKAGSLQTK